MRRWTRLDSIGGEGGYAVEKRVGPNQGQLVAVDVGFFGSDNRIAVTSDSLQPGDQVVVP